MKKLRCLILHGDPDVIVGFIGLLTMLWGLWLCLPFDAFGSSKSFDLMASIAPSWVWGAGIAFAGLFKLYVLLSAEKSWLSVAINFIIFLVWVFVAASFIISNWRSAGTVIYPCFALASFWGAARRYAQLLGAR